jgi:hypothetical protein
MIDKITLTERILRQLSLPIDPKSVRKYNRLWWRNPRTTKNNGFRLTDEGFEVFTKQMDLTKYEIDYPKEVEWSNELILRLDKYLESPYYLQKKNIVIFREKTAIELILYGGDIQKYGRAKAASAKKTA